MPTFSANMGERFRVIFSINSVVICWIKFLWMSNLALIPESGAIRIHHPIEEESPR